VGGIGDFMDEQREHILQARNARIQAVATEVDYDYAVFDTNHLYVVRNGERKSYFYQTLTSEIKRELGVEHITAYDVVGGAEKLYFSARYAWHDTTGADGKIIETYDVAVISIDYQTGECELVYCAYPPAVKSDDDVLFEDEYVCDAVVYGAAMELLTSVRPADVQRYMRIATEYDERMAGMISSAAAGVVNTLFSLGRGLFI
jgi:hypothetical protein